MKTKQSRNHVKDLAIHRLHDDRFLADKLIKELENNTNIDSSIDDSIYDMIDDLKRDLGEAEGHLNSEVFD